MMSIISYKSKFSIFASIAALQLFSCIAHANTLSCKQALTPSNLTTVTNGGAVHTEPKKLGKLDQTTIANLEINKLILKPLLDLAPTSLGKVRIRHLLINPHLNREDILQRQAVLKELDGNSDLTSSVYELMKKAETKPGCLKHLDQNLTKGGDYMAGFPGLVVAGLPLSLCAIGAMAATIDLRIGIVLMAKAGGTNLAITNFPQYDSMRNIFTQGKKIARLLESVQAPELKKIKDVLNSLNTQEDPYGMQEIYRATHQLAPNEPMRYLQSFTQSRMLIRTFGYRKVRKWRENIAIYLSAWSELEAYITAATYLNSHTEQMVIPEILDSEFPSLEIVDGHHPYYFFKDREQSVSNSVHLTSAEEGMHKSAIITGPNAGGKTTFLRMISLNILLAQAGFPVPAKSMSLTPTQVATNFAVIDSTEDGHSTFMSQSLRLAEIYRLLASGEHAFIALDEILTGTSQDEHRAGEKAAFIKLHDSPNALSMLATHGRSLTQLADEYDDMTNLQVTLEGFQIVDGESTVYNAIDVMRRAGVPADVLKAMQDEINQNRQTEQ